MAIAGLTAALGALALAMTLREHVLGEFAAERRRVRADALTGALNLWNAFPWDLEGSSPRRHDRQLARAATA